MTNSKYMCVTFTYFYQSNTSHKALWQRARHGPYFIGQHSFKGLLPLDILSPIYRNQDRFSYSGCCYNIRDKAIVRYVGMH